MSTKSTTDNSNFETMSLPAFVHTPTSFKYATTHVFFPGADRSDYDCTLDNDLSLARIFCAAAHAYGTHVHSTPQWHRITRMLDNLQAFAHLEHLDKHQVVSQLRGMQTGDILSFFIRPQNAAIILTKQENCTLFESFQVPPGGDAVDRTMGGALMASYPRSAVETPNKIFDDENFQSQLAKFVSCAERVDPDLPLRFPDHPEYTAGLLTGILRGVDHTIATHIVDRTADIPRITKRLRYQVTYFGSPHWLLIRVAIQMSLDRSPLGRTSYKGFMLFIMCTLARDSNNENISSDQLHLILSKIFRRLKKLGSSTPDWLSDMALKTCTCLREILDARWKQPSARTPPFQNPSQDELRRDIRLSLLHNRQYICDALANPGHKPSGAPFYPNHRRRGTINDFLALHGSFFEEAFKADPEVTLYDVEQSVEQGIDDWLACVTNVDEACAQLEILMENYMTKAEFRRGDPEDKSIMLLTAVELLVALDKLVVKQIPMLADYSPEIPMVLLEGLLLRKTTSLHRLSRAYQYLSARQSRSRPEWSVLSSVFTNDSFAARYYDQSPHLQQLKIRIEEDAVVAGRSGLEREPATGFTESQSPLPTLLLHTKIVVFELQCPPCVRIWRSAVARIRSDRYFDLFSAAMGVFRDHGVCVPLVRIAALQPYLAERQPSRSDFQIRLAYVYPPDSRPRNDPSVLYYAVESLHSVKMWRLKGFRISPAEFTYRAENLSLGQYVSSTSHTSNDVLSAQSVCPAGLSIDELIAFGHLRSAGSLQWLSVLRELRSRTLNLRRHDVHSLLAQMAFQVGPLDSSTGTWIWHKELQDSSFCGALLDELDSLFAEVGVGLIDGVMMDTISLLLTRVLASSPSESVSKRVIALLRSVRRKTFSWVQELSYNLAIAPLNEERSKLLHDMAATCRSTFNVDPANLCKLLHSAEDLDALLSCAFFIYALHSESDGYSQLLFRRDRRLALALEGILGDVIITDVSDFAVDLAVSRIFTSHTPSAHRWVQLQYPNARWLTCRTGGQHLQTLHVNLLDGLLRVNGQQLGGLPSAIRDSPECRQIFRDQGFFVMPSNLPGMDFTTLAMTSKPKVHFLLRGDDLVVRVQCNQSNEILELIPSRKLEEDLPPVLVNGHVHWLNLSTKIIEIRPLEQLWEQSSENWRIDCTSEQYCMYKGPETLVDIQSPTWAIVAEYFKCLNVDNMFKNILVTASLIDSPHHGPALRLSVALPYYDLSFFVNSEGELESRDFKDMVCDESQCIGALFGLETLLVLRHRTHFQEERHHRRVLIPNGFPERDGDRVWVNTQHNESTGTDNPLYYTYNVDTELGCLIGNGSLTSTRYLAYLHAATSCYRPDPLTSKTGAQAALCLLQSVGCQSIMKLKTLRSDRVWTSTRYPQINIAHQKIQHRHLWRRHLPKHGQIDWEYEHAARHAAYLFPWHATGPTSTSVSAEPGLLTPSATSYLQDISNKHTPWWITLNQLLSTRPAPELPARSTLPRDKHKTPPNDIPEFDQLGSSLLKNKVDSAFQREYIARLNASAQRVRNESRIIYRLMGKNHIEALEEYYAQCRKNYLAALRILKRNLGPTSDPDEQVLDRFGQWPPITADVLLRCLASTSQIDISAHWKKCLVSLALLLLDLQHARRLLQFSLGGLEEEFSMELENEVCDGWDPEDNPEWLLIQIQGNFLIRRDQAETAMEMISPKSGGNTVMQVNMGEGKTSVIIPIVAATLADGKQLVRIVVPKALTVQMFELLVTRLGGLANRPIYHLPFSRTPEYDEHGQFIGPEIDDLHELMSQCMAEHGILLVQPEHVASLKLMGVEKQIREGKLAPNLLQKPRKLIHEHIVTALWNIFRSLRQLSGHSSKVRGVRANRYDERSGNADGTLDSAAEWLSIQKWIHSHVRDILDESDEILHPRFQLVYTIGLEQHMDGYPERWTITQQVLRLAKECAHTISRNHSNFIEYECDPPGSFPHVRIVGGPDVGRDLVSLIVQDVMGGGLPDFNFPHVPQPFRDAIRSFISDEDVLPETAKSVEEYAEGSGQRFLWKGLLLLRGLLASHILLFTLAGRRWRVDYGLDLQPRDSDHSPASTMLAIPYRAKDMPTPNTQFGHPDIAIILTCLSYYYTGLSEEQLRAAFEILLDQEDPSTEYARWIKEYGFRSVPDSLQKLGEVNTRSSEQWDKVIFPLFSRNQAAIDFYLSRVVFPRAAKEFPWKFSASSWDLAEKREKVITGFSGTNDGQWLLPMSITQCDLDHQQGTNARVLAYLLQPENDSYMVIQESGERRTTLEILRMVTKQHPEIRVLLDVGAQILDFSNVRVAKSWLDITRDVAGAIYFNENDELMVLTKNGIIQSMRSSPLSQQLDRCVVYLDHAHTRGTDLKLPVGSRAAVTLGPRITKDSLVQGCMRMRKLGHGHSVMFFAPLEVDRSIRAVVGKNEVKTRVGAIDIIRWTIHETWTDIQQRAPYWAQQGMNHKSRSDAWSRFCDDELGPDQLSDAWLQPELKSLAYLYAPCELKEPLGTLSVLDPEIRQRCKDLGVLSLPNAQMTEEQEREVNREREREREVELPPGARPAEHYLHPDVIKFVNTGDIPPLNADSAFHPVFTSLEESSAATRDADVWSPFILATADFCRTIRPESTQGTMDQYLRPVQWILSRRALEDRDPVLVLLSPFEADSLMPVIRTSECVYLHLYAPRTSQRMKPSDDLKLYSIPPLPSDWTPPWALIDQLNVFAGQLYLRDYQSYLRLCRFLDVPTKDSPNDSAVRWNLFNIPGSFEENEIRFLGSPLPSVSALLAIRNRGRPFTETHMGKILQGQQLTEKDFRRPTSVVSSHSPPPASATTSAIS